MGKPRPMGYIFPKRIQSTIAGETTKKTYYGGGLTEEEKEEFRLKREEEAIAREERLKVLQDTKSPWICTTCDKIMRNKLDQKYFNRRGMCMECTIKGETYLKIHGLFGKYEEGISLRNYKAYLIDIKEQAIDFVSNLKEETKVVNHDGSFDTLRSDITEAKEFMLNEIKDIDKKLEELVDVDISISTEESLGINLKEIVKNILIEEKNRERLVEQDS